MAKAYYIDDGKSLEQMLNWAKELGVTDLSTIKVRMTSEIMCCGHNDGSYCYCGIGHTDIRLQIDNYESPTG